MALKPDKSDVELLPAHGFRSDAARAAEIHASVLKTLPEGVHEAVLKLRPERWTLYLDNRPVVYLPAILSVPLTVYADALPPADAGAEEPFFQKVE